MKTPGNQKQGIYAALNVAETGAILGHRALLDYAAFVRHHVVLTSNMGPAFFNLAGKESTCG